MKIDDSPSMRSHEPVLRMLGRTGLIENVLELGSGKFSTALFLDKSVFPNLKRLVSIEHSPKWRNVVRDLFSDSRLRIDHVSENDMFEKLDDMLDTWLQLKDIDLVLIDNADTYQFRIKTIEHLAAKNFTCPVVIHDFEMEKYRDAAKGFDYQMIFVSEIPSSSNGPFSWTGVCWNGEQE